MNSINYPTEWEIQSFSHIADFINGAAFKPTDWKTEGLPIIRIQNLNNPETEFNYFDGKLDERYYVKNGDILLSWSASLGVYRWDRGNAILNQHIFNVKPKGEINEDFLFYISHKAIDDLSRKVHGSTMKHFKKRELDEAKVPVPPLVEQRGIVEVLGTVDECIRLTDTVIERAEGLKRGLMQQLLTRGIGHTEYKETEIGEIPEEWEVIELYKVAHFQNGRFFQSEDYTNEGIKLLRPGNLHQNGFIEWSKSNTIYLPIEYASQASDWIVRGNEIVMNLTAQSLEDEFLGRVCLSSDNEYCLLNQRIARISSKVIDTGFLFWILKSWIFRRFVDRLPGGTKIKHIYSREIGRFRLPRPPLKEQIEISKILFETLNQKAIEEKRLLKLDALKKGLMQVLLSGNIRVGLKGDELHRIGDSREANN